MIQLTRRTFEDRLQEIDSYLELLTAVESEVQAGIPRIGGETGTVISGSQQKILYSSVYLQLYNLIESTITLSINALSSVIIQRNTSPADLCEDIRREWIRFSARTHIDLNYENRLKSALELCQHLIQSLPISSFEIQKGGGGNWDDVEIELMAKRLGMNFRLDPLLYSKVKRPFRNDMGPLVFVRALRNDLAHGSVSFVECGTGVTASDLEALKNVTAKYLDEVIGAFETMINALEFLVPEKRGIPA